MDFAASFAENFDVDLWWRSDSICFLLESRQIAALEDAVVAVAMCFFCVSACFAFFSGSDGFIVLCHFFWKGLMGLPLFGGVSDAFIYDVFLGGRAVGWVWGVFHMGFSNKFIVSRRE